MAEQIDWHARAARQTYITECLIDGRFTHAVAGKTYDSINPANGLLLGRVAACDAHDVDLAVKAARRTFDSGVWSRIAPAARKQVMLKLSQLMQDHVEELALLESLDVGKPIQDALHVDIPGAANVFRWYAESVDKLYGQVAPQPPGVLATITREALGVVAAVVPWNFPLDLASWKLAPALAAGNSVVLKPAEQSPATALRLAELALEAGVPPGVFNVVTGIGGVTGRALGLHPDVDCLVFTGSTEVGKYFMSYSAQSNLKQVWLECGGKSSNIVFADCGDLDLAVKKAAFGIFYNQGEVCSANSRLLVERAIYDEFIDRLVAHCSEWQPADPLLDTTRMGSLVDARQTARVMRDIEQARTQGAQLITGGNQLTIHGSSNFITPTIFGQIDNQQALWKEEVFGPVLAVMPFGCEADAVRLANDSIYALAASLWTDNLHRAHRVASALRAGTVSVNTVDALDVTVPFGGGRQSGFGRDLSLHSFDKYTELKTTWMQFR